MDTEMMDKLMICGVMLILVGALQDEKIVIGLFRWSFYVLTFVPRMIIRRLR